MVFPAAFPFPKFRVDEDGFVKGLHAIEGVGHHARAQSILSEEALAGLDIRVSAYTALPDNIGRGNSQIGFGDEEMRDAAAGSSTGLKSRARTLSNIVASIPKRSNVI